MQKMLTMTVVISKECAKQTKEAQETPPPDPEDNLGMRPKQKSVQNGKEGQQSSQ